MKTKLIILLTLLVGSLLIAATFTVDIPTADVPRVSEAYGSIYSLGHPANVTEVQEITRRWIMESTKDYERRKNQATYSPPPLEMQPTPTPAPSPTAFGVTAAKVAPTPTPTPKGKKKQ